jgi:hypothetical protein
VGRSQDDWGGAFRRVQVCQVAPKTEALATDNCQASHVRLGMSYLERAWRLHGHKRIVCQPTENPRNPFPLMVSIKGLGNGTL